MNESQLIKVIREDKCMKLKSLLAFFHCAIICSLSACDWLDIDLKKTTSSALIVDNSEPSGQSYEEGLANVLEKANQLAFVKYHALSQIPSHKANYSPGGPYRGVPYSSVRSVGTYVGFNVSFYTFLSASHNPRSRLYTEDLRLPPYHSDNCATYYGTVCSAAVLYAWGIRFPLHADQIINHPSVSRIKGQIADSLMVGDILHKSGHVIMITDIKREDGAISNISILESMTKTSIETYSINKFNERWKKDGFTAYRYANIKDSKKAKEDIWLTSNWVDNLNFNKSLCPDRGDKAAYDINEEIVLNILEEGYDSLEIYKQSELIACIETTEPDIVFKAEEAGIYTARLVGKTSCSDFVNFEVLDYNIEYDNVGEEISVHFTSKYSNPSVVFLCSYQGGFLSIHILSQNEIKQGHVIMPALDKSSYYLRMVMEGEYGSIYTEPIEIRSTLTSD